MIEFLFIMFSFYPVCSHMSDSDRLIEGVTLPPRHPEYQLIMYRHPVYHCIGAFWCQGS